MKLVRGRYFADSDNELSENVAVVNEAFVRRFFSTGEDAIDRRFGLNLPENVNTFRIVGIVGDARFAGFQLNQPARPMFFVPLAQTVKYANPIMQRVETASHYVGGILLVTNTPQGSLEPLVARALAEADPNLTVINIRTLEEQVARSFDQQRAVASLAGLFGVVALVLAAIGLYGVTAYTVARRRSEIGLRMALGADRGNVIGMVLGGAFKRVAIGLVLGAPLAVGAGYLLSAQLYGVSFWDPVALSVAAGVAGVRRIRRLRGAGIESGSIGADDRAAHRLEAGRRGRPILYLQYAKLGRRARQSHSSKRASTQADTWEVTISLAGAAWLQFASDFHDSRRAVSRSRSSPERKVGLISGNEEASANAWRLKLWRTHCRKRYWFLGPLYFRLLRASASPLLRIARRRAAAQRAAKTP